MKRPLVWAGTLVTAVVTGVAIAVASNLANSAVSGGNNSQASSGGAAGSLRPYVAVRREAGFAGGCGSWIVTKPPQGLSPPPQSNDWEKWIAQNHAIDASPQGAGSGRPGSGGASNLDVTIQGRAKTPVVLTGIQFIAVRRNPGMIQGGLITNTCGGPMDARYMIVNLDDNPIKVIASHRDPFPARSGEPWLAKPIRFPYSVTDTDGEVFKIIAYAHSDVSWYAKLSWSVNGKNGESIINDHGKPFQTAPLLRAKAAYGYDGHRWYICSGSVGAWQSCPIQR